MDELRRTMVTAQVAALRTFEAEAHRRGVPLSTLPAEAVEDKAMKLRRQRRPRGRVARSTDGRAARDVAAETIADDARSS